MYAVWKSATQILPGIILLHAHPQVVYCNRVKFHQYWSIRKGGRVALTKHWTDERTGCFLLRPKQLCLRGV